MGRDRFSGGPGRRFSAAVPQFTHILVVRFSGKSYHITPAALIRADFPLDMLVTCRAHISSPRVLQGGGVLCIWYETGGRIYHALYPERALPHHPPPSMYSRSSHVCKGVTKRLGCIFFSPSSSALRGVVFGLPPPRPSMGP